MPNGSGLTMDEYTQLQACLAPIDAECEAFGQNTAAATSREGHGLPHRQFLYIGVDNVTRCISITPILYDQGPPDCYGRSTSQKRHAPYFVFDVAAWKDELHRRSSWHKRFATYEQLPTITDLRELLQRMLELVTSIRVEDLS